MNKKTDYTIVGVFVILLTVLLVVIVFWLSGTERDKVYNTYMVYVGEEVTGLSLQSSVRYNGVPVGYVQSIKLDPDNPQLVQLTLKIQENSPISTSTVATLNEQGITGVVYVALKATSSNAPLLKALPGQTYPVIPSKPSLFLQLSTVLPEITHNFKGFTDGMSDLLSKDNQTAISQSLQNINQFTGSLSKSSEDLTDSVRSLKATLDNTSQASEDLPNVMKKLDGILDQVSVIAVKVDAAGQNIQKTSHDTQIVMRNFSSQVMPNLQQMMHNLNQLSKNLSTLSSNLERDPSMLVRGKQPQAPGPGEKQ